jgi:death-on-curing protein
VTPFHTEPLFLTVDEVVALHDDQLHQFGGSDGIRDASSLDSAVAVPTSTFDGAYLHVDLFEMAAAYAFHIAENQPFLDGNKRTGLNAAIVFLDLNGWLVLDPNERLVDAMLQLAIRATSKQELAILLRELSRPLSESEIE